MKLIIAGSRTMLERSSFIDNMMDLAIDKNILITEVVCGMARGSDMAGKLWAEENEILVAKFPADWDKHGKAAGHIRNSEMAKYGDALLLIWDGSSRGSANMKQNMEKLGKPVYKVIIKVPKVEEEL